MTITPIPMTPPSPQAPGPGSTPPEIVPGDPAGVGFAALIAQLVSGHLELATTAPSGTAPATGTVGEGDTDADVETDGEGHGATDATDATELGATAAAPVALTTGPVGVVDDRQAGQSKQPAGGQDGAATAVTAVVGRAKGPVDTGPAPTPVRDTGEPVAVAPPPTPAAHTPGGPGTGDTPGVPPTATAPAQATTHHADGTAARPTAPVPVMGQLSPEVTRMITRGDGTHRLTLKLQPEALGEVRVTLTVRQGEVHVRLAAGDDARRALAEGAPELRRVLELAGATDARVVVRDLPAPAAPQHAHTPAAHAAGGGAGHGDATAFTHGGDRRDHPDHQDAGTRAGSNATDGTSDGARPPRPEPVRHARSSGVDLTM